MYGVAAPLGTTDLGRAVRMAERLGILGTNCPDYLPVNVFHEGQRMSRLGEHLGVEALNALTHLQTFWSNFGDRAMAWA